MGHTSFWSLKFTFVVLHALDLPVSLHFTVQDGNLKAVFSGAEFGSGKGEIVQAHHVLTGEPELTFLVSAHRVHHLLETRAALTS